MYTEFFHFELIVEGNRILNDGSVYIWKLREGVNSLDVASVNDVGRSGFHSEFELNLIRPLSIFESRRCRCTESGHRGCC